MGAQLFIEAVMDPGLELVHILGIYLRQKPISILLYLLSAILIADFILVGADLAVEHHRRKIPCLVHQFHRQDLFFLPQQNVHRNSPRLKRLEYQIRPYPVHSQNSVGIILLRINDPFDKTPIHQFVQFVLHTPSPFCHTLCLSFRL